MAKHLLKLTSETSILSNKIILQFFFKWKLYIENHSIPMLHIQRSVARNMLYCKVLFF